MRFAAGSSGGESRVGLVINPAVDALGVPGPKKVEATLAAAAAGEVAVMEMVEVVMVPGMVVISSISKN